MRDVSFEAVRQPLSLSRDSTNTTLSPRTTDTPLSSRTDSVVTGFDQFETSSLLPEPSNSRTEPAEPSNSRTEPAEPSNSRILKKNTQPKNVCCFPFDACCSVDKREESQR